MENYRYRLQPYSGRKTRNSCPGCGCADSFVRYIDTNTGEKLADHVGRCNKEINCGYHVTPKAYFKGHGNIGQDLNPAIYKPKRYSDKRSYIPRYFMDRSLQSDHNNCFLNYLKALFGENIMAMLKDKFLIGTSNHWPGSTIFWQVDAVGRVRAGKIMLYDPETGKRIKQPVNRITWVHSILKRKNLLSEFHLEQCFFGEHQLNSLPNNMPIAVVESEKTAIIASVYLPEYIWLATGGLNNLNEKHFLPVKDRKIVVFPDTGCLSRWESACEKIENGLGVELTISDLLERRIRLENISAGFDLADFLVKRDFQIGWALTNENYPLFWDL